MPGKAAAFGLSLLASEGLSAEFNIRAKAA